MEKYYGFNDVYVIGDWKVFRFKSNGKVRWYVGRISEGGYRWTTLTKREAIDICNAAYNVEKKGIE